MDNTLDIATYTSELEKFTNEYVAGFYTELLKDRMLFNRGAPGFLSAQTTLLNVLTSLLVEASPILMHTSQEVFQHMPECLFPEKKPITIFQLPWPQLFADSAEMTELLSNFELRE